MEIIGLLEVLSVERSDVVSGMISTGILKRVDEFQGTIKNLSDDILSTDSGFTDEVKVEIDKRPIQLQGGGIVEGYGESDFRKGIRGTGYKYVYPVHLKEMITIGRDGNACNFVVDHPATSSIHAYVWSVNFDSQTEPLIYINDRSRNGVYVNGTAVGRGQTAIIRHEDTIELKKAIKFKFTKISRRDSNTPIALPLFKVKDWTICSEVIGSGSYGSVYVCNRSNYTKIYAVKIIQNVGSTAASAEQRDKVRNEANILMKTNHPNIVKIHEAIFVSNSLYLFEDLVCGGDLFSYLTTGETLRPIPEKEAILIVFQLLKALDYLHNTLSVIHRDLKLDNVLLEAPVPCTRIYICDFGIAKSLKSLKQRSQTVVGTVEYSAPEIFVDNISGSALGIGDLDFSHSSSSSTLSSLSQKEGYTYKCDMWSLGVMMHIMLSGISPFFADGRNKNIIRNVMAGKLDFDRPGFSSVSHAARNFLTSLIQTDPNKRASVDECFVSPWINHNRDNLELIYKDKIIGS